MLALRHFAALDQLEGLQTPVVLATINPVYYNDAIASIIGYLTQGGMKGVYVTLNKPVATLKQSLQRMGVQTSNLKFIDAITAVKEQESEDCTYLGPNQELTNLCMAIARTLAKLEAGGFIVFDSLSTLLIYNDERSVSRFAHILTEKLRANEVYSVLLSVQAASEKDMISRLAQFADRIVFFGEDLPG